MAALPLLFISTEAIAITMAQVGAVTVAVARAGTVVASIKVAAPAVIGAGKAVIAAVSVLTASAAAPVVVAATVAAPAAAPVVAAATAATAATATTAAATTVAAGPIAALAAGAGAVAYRMGMFDSSSAPPTGPGLGPSPRMPKIPKKMLMKLLKLYGRKIYKKLKEKARCATNTRNAWNNADFRIDLGQAVKGHSHLKTWNLQFNKKASKVIRDMFTSQGYTTHTKLLWAVFDIANPPEYEAWVEAILALYE